MPTLPRLIWLPEAIEDIVRLREFIELKDARAAKRAGRCILDGAHMLQQHPEAGTPLGDDRRELFVPFGNSAYVLRYRLDGPDIVIIRVWHGRESRYGEP